MGTGPEPESGIAERAWAVLATVADPEIPVISVVDLGIVRDLNLIGGTVEVGLTPTYAGCPAMHVIERDIADALAEAGISAHLVTRLDPPWTTDWITREGRAKLKAFGIAPPAPVDHHASQVIHLAPRAARTQRPPACPHCGSAHTELLSQFGSTACKALCRCLDCREPFDYFKPL